MQVIINAGGSGSRLWPLSTKTIPKQFVGILGEETLLQKTFFRMLKVVKAENIWISTNEKHKDIVIKQLGPNFDPNHILTEPERRDTFAAVVCHSAIVASNTRLDEPIIHISSDHFIDLDIDFDAFCSNFENIKLELLNNHFSIILPATNPTYPATGFGYIEYEKDKKQTINKVLSFKEKPDLEKAQEFLKKGNFLWNLGYFAFTFQNLEKITNKLYPDLSPILQSVFRKQLIDSKDYSKFPKNSFDFAILEKIDNLGVVDMNLTSWSDIGSYDAIYKLLNQSSNSDFFIELEGEENKIVSFQKNEKVAFVGVSNLLYIRSQEGTLIINPNNSSSVKDVSKWFDKD
ncbi:MAG: sugar phosphate nucleotidyltransferase [Patescibacteria group bacterium]